MFGNRDRRVETALSKLDAAIAGLREIGLSYVVGVNVPTATGPKCVGSVSGGVIETVPCLLALCHKACAGQPEPLGTILLKSIGDALLRKPESGENTDANLLVQMGYSDPKEEA